MFGIMLLVCILLSCAINCLAQWPITCDIDRVKNFTYCDTASKLVPPGDRYSDTECLYYVTPYKSLTAFHCPFIVARMSENDNNCYTFYYTNGSELTINIKMEQKPTHLQIGQEHSTGPFNGETLYLLCPLYGTPPLNYTWTIPINGINYTGFNPALLARLKNTDEIGYGDEIGDQLSNIYFSGLYEPDCPAGIEILYKLDLLLDGYYYCTGTNEYGTETVLVTLINNGFLCISSSNLAFGSAQVRNLGLGRNYKVSPEEIGGNITVTCKLAPFSSNVNMFWVKTMDVDGIGLFCSDENNSNPYSLITDSKYTINSRMESQFDANNEGPNCTKALSLTIHRFEKSDETQYTCVADICSSKGKGDRLYKTIVVSGDSDTIASLMWIFSFLSVPLVFIAVSLLTAGVLMYVYKVRLIRWYIAWKREEPIGQFEYDVFVCTAEEYKREFVEEVHSELIERLTDVRVFWSEHDHFNLAGRNHYVNACELLTRCRKFVFVVDSRFENCFFCKQMMELAIEKSSVKNWNMILPVKWYPDSPVQESLLVYRYVERLGDTNCIREIENFIKSRQAPNRNERNVVIGYEMAEFNDAVNDLDAPLISS